VVVERILSDRLVAAEAELKTAREVHRQATTASQKDQPPALQASEIEGILKELAELLTTDTVQARAKLARYLDDGRRKLQLDIRRGEVRLSGALDLGGAVKFVAGARNFRL
jgi:hypothetical protein